MGNVWAITSAAHVGLDSLPRAMRRLRTLQRQLLRLANRAHSTPDIAWTRNRDAACWFAILYRGNRVNGESEGDGKDQAWYRAYALELSLINTKKADEE